MLHNVYEGIFEKDFTLFYGEKMVCMIHEEKDGKKTQSGPFTLLPRTEMPEDNDMQSRYGMLNEMCRAFSAGQIKADRERNDKYVGRTWQYFSGN